MLRVSLIIPCFNSQKTLKQCLESVGHQLHPFDEIILVDNNSTDSSIQIAKNFTNIQIHTCLNRGASSARNIGWRKAKHELIAFVDSDVILDPSWLQKMLKTFKDDKIVSSQSQVIPSIDKDLRWLDIYRHQLKKAKTKSSWVELDNKNNVIAINTAACIYRKTTLIELDGFEERLARLEDTDLALKARYLGGLKATVEAKATVIFSGELISYLIRSFKDGMAYNTFCKFWKTPKAPYQFYLRGFRFQLFEFLNFLFFNMGYFLINFRKKKSPPYSRKKVELLLKIKKLNSVSG